MLELKNLYKTFNPGTINEKLALNGLSLTLKEGDFVTRDRRQRSRKIHHAECSSRNLDGRRRPDPY